MKYYILLIASVLVTVQALTEEQKVKIKQFRGECSASTGVDKEVVAKGRKGEFTGDAKLKEYLFCMSKKSGFQNDAGDIQFDALKAQLGAALNDAAKASALVDKCAVKKATPQDTAYDTCVCYYETTQRSLV